MSEARQFEPEPFARPAASARGTRGPGPPRLSGRNSYSLFVGFMKMFLPALAAGLILLLIAWPRLKPFDDRYRIRVTDFSLEQADNLSMINARFQGLDENNQPFNITADMATRTSGQQDTIELVLPKADILLQDGTWLALTASAGRYRRDSNILDLSGQVNLFHDRGLELRTETARIDLKAGEASGSEPVEGQGPFGLLNAEGFRLFDRGMRIVFTGKSRLVVNAGAKEAVR